jgi:hypothetical protein
MRKEDFLRPLPDGSTFVSIGATDALEERMEIEIHLEFTLPNRLYRNRRENSRNGKIADFEEHATN